MESVPVDILLNILEYEGNLSCVSDEQIIERIQQYEPTFSLDEWKKQVQIKEDFLSKYKNHPLQEVYDIVKNSAGHIRVIDNSSDLKCITIGVDTCNDELDEGERSILERICSIFGRIFSIREFSYERNFVNIYSDQLEEMERMIKYIWIYNNSTDRTDSYENFKRFDRYNKFLEITDVLHIPTSLPEYLRFILSMKKQEEEIKQWREYPLYLLLKSYGWYCISNPSYNNSTFVINEDDIDDMGSNVYMSICDELVRLYGSYEDNFDRLVIPCVNLRLIEIDSFYHPHVPSNLDCLYDLR